MSVRFAPSPTGRFHLGNLRTAWVSHLFARTLQMPWVVRFEDIDGPRVVAGARETQLEDLRLLGMIPDRIVIQSARRERHETLFRAAVASGQAYPCTCSRKELSHSVASAPHGDVPLYTGRCRDPGNRGPGAHPSVAWRFLNPENEEGKLDFVIARTAGTGTDFVPAYHWACALDDFDGKHSLLVRASDLAPAAKIQARIHAWVATHEGHTERYPAVFHASLVTANDGSRLEKRTRGITLPEMTSAGLSPELILKRFGESFDPGLLAPFAHGEIRGEARERISLVEIGC